MTAAYWLIGRRVVEFEQKGKARAAYGERLLQRLAQDLSAKFGRGFSYPNLNKFRQFYLTYPQERILSTVSIESAPTKIRTPSGKSQMLSAENIDGLVIGYLKILFGILFTIITNSVQIVPPILTG